MALFAARRARAWYEDEVAEVRLALKPCVQDPSEGGVGRMDGTALAGVEAVASAQVVKAAEGVALVVHRAEVFRLHERHT
jgi:hypothetical protein